MLSLKSFLVFIVAVDVIFLWLSLVGPVGVCVCYRPLIASSTCRYPEMGPSEQWWYRSGRQVSGPGMHASGWCGPRLNKLVEQKGNQ
jgi:hypothetical protein